MSSIVYCGYGEPTYRLDDLITVARAVKERYPAIKIRINTNGHSDLIFGENTAPRYARVIDKLSISLNTPSPERYVEICHPVFGESAHAALINFAKNARDYVPEVVFSVVRETLSDAELSECCRIAREAGVTLRVRDYIPPER